jgi:hypothetical protein
MKLAFKVGLVAFALAIVYVSWCVTTPQVAKVSLSPTSYCEMRIPLFYTRGATIDYYQNHHRVGGLTMVNDFLFDQEAIYPGPDGHSVVCLSWPDTVEAAFTIDFSRRSRSSSPTDSRIRENLVEKTDFEVRACTTDEVASVRHFIQTADLKTFAACTRWGARAENEDTRQGELLFLSDATTQWTHARENRALLMPVEPAVTDAAH